MGTGARTGAGAGGCFLICFNGDSSTDARTGVVIVFTVVVNGIGAVIVARAAAAAARVVDFIPVAVTVVVDVVSAVLMLLVVALLDLEIAVVAKGANAFPAREGEEKEEFIFRTSPCP